MNVAPFAMCCFGVMTSLFAGHIVPLREFAAALVDKISGEQAGGNGLCLGPPTGFTCDAWCARGSGSPAPFGSPGYVGRTKRQPAVCPLTVTYRMRRSGPSVLLALPRSKSSEKLVRHCFARSRRTTEVPVRSLFVAESYTRCT